MNKICLIILVILHHAILWCLTITPFICLIFQPWYITIFTTVVIIRIGTSRARCIATDFENYLRKKLGFKPIDGFIKHYYLRRIKKLISA